MKLMVKAMLLPMGVLLTCESEQKTIYHWSKGQIYTARKLAPGWELSLQELIDLIESEILT